jgi:hypothetical protein
MNSQVQQLKNYVMDNHRIFKSVPFDDGDKVEILERKRNLIRESKYLARRYIPLIKKKDTKY